jgi:Tfp pilus tip-associated adhesin PilY1
MSISDSAVRAGRVLFTTLIPEQDPCGFGGTGWLMAVDAMTGARPLEAQFDLNFDGRFDAGDNSSGQVVTGLKSEVGIVQRPGVLADNANSEFKLYVSGTSGGNPGGIGTDTRASAGVNSILNDGPPGQSSDMNDQASTNAKFDAFQTGRQSWRQVR